jgi:hypothetical protein
MRFSGRHLTAGEDAFDAYLEEAERIRGRAEEEVAEMAIEPAALEPDFERMRWFPLAHDVIGRLRESRQPTA